MSLHVKSIHSLCDGSLDRSFMVDPLSYFTFQAVLHDWCNKGRGMCHPVWDGAYKRKMLYISNGSKSS